MLFVCSPEGTCFSSHLQGMGQPATTLPPQDRFGCLRQAERCEWQGFRGSFGMLWRFHMFFYWFHQHESTNIRGYDFWMMFWWYFCVLEAQCGHVPFRAAWRKVLSMDSKPRSCAWEARCDDVFLLILDDSGEQVGTIKLYNNIFIHTIYYSNHGIYSYNIYIYIWYIASNHDCVWAYSRYEVDEYIIIILLLLIIIMIMIMMIIIITITITIYIYICV